VIVPNPHSRPRLRTAANPRDEKNCRKHHRQLSTGRPAVVDDSNIEIATRSLKVDVPLVPASCRHPRAHHSMPVSALAHAGGARHRRRRVRTFGAGCSAAAQKPPPRASSSHAYPTRPLTVAMRGTIAIATGRRRRPDRNRDRGDRDRNRDVRRDGPRDPRATDGRAAKTAAIRPRRSKRSAGRARPGRPAAEPTRRAGVPRRTGPAHRPAARNDQPPRNTNRRAASLAPAIRRRERPAASAASVAAEVDGGAAAAGATGRKLRQRCRRNQGANQGSGQGLGGPGTGRLPPQARRSGQGAVPRHSRNGARDPRRLPKHRHAPRSAVSIPHDNKYVVCPPLRVTFRAPSGRALDDSTPSARARYAERAQAPVQGQAGA